MKKYFVAAFTCALIALVWVSPAVKSQDSAKAQRPQAKFRRNARPVAGQYIVVLNDEAVGSRGENSRAPGLAAEMGSAHRGNVQHVFKHALQGFSVRMPEAAAQALSRDPRVLFVEEDGELTLAATQTLPGDGSVWGLDRIDQRDQSDGLYHYERTGAGVNVYVIDTGIRTSHLEFGGRASAAFDAFGGNGQDCNGHGTHVAGIIGGATYGVAKGVNLFGVRVADCLGGGSASTIIAGVDWVTNHHAGPSIANMSVGIPLSAALDLAVTNSINSGVTYIVAAGNDTADACNYSPARVSAAYTVGATADVTDVRKSDSNFGACVDLFAPGQNIRSAWHTSDTATALDGGTSMAAPHVTGIAALQIEAAASTLFPTSPCRVKDAGTGSPTKLAFSETGTVFCGVPPICQGVNCRQFVGWVAPNTVTPWGEPCGSVFIQAPAGAHQAWLTGPVGADFELALMKEVHPPGMASFMIAVAVGDAAGSACESASYTGAAALYYWRVKSKNGTSGNFTVTYTVP